MIRFATKPDCVFCELLYCAILKTNNRSGVSGLIRVDRVELKGAGSGSSTGMRSGRLVRAEPNTRSFLF
jgi:hypothetical protein